MTGKPEDIDREMQALFRSHNRQLNDEPFVSSTLQLIDGQRRRAAFARLLWQALGLGVIALLSPLLIQASSWSSDRMEKLFSFSNSVLETPAGMFCAALVVVFFVLASRKHRLAGMRYLPINRII
jgi:hypothetical protein